MRNRIATIAIAAIASLGLVISTTACDPAPTASKVTNTVDIACAAGTYATPTDWYLPATASPKGLVWLQHGFTESKDDWAEYGKKLSDAGFIAMATTLPTADIFGCTVENVGNNTGYLNNIATLFGGMGTSTRAIERSWADAQTTAGRTTTALLPSKLLFVGHSAGGEAVTYVANRLRTNHATTFAKLKGLVLEDPVNSFIGDNLSAGLTGLNGTTLPIYALASPSYSCNNNQAGVALVTSKLTTRTFHGVQVTSGSHGDVFGGAISGIEASTCGTPQAKNTAAVQTLSTAWLTDQAAGSKTATYYPGGATYQGLVTAGTITTLP